MKFYEFNLKKNRNFKSDLKQKINDIRAFVKQGKFRSAKINEVI